MKKLNSGLIFERFSEKKKTPFEKLFEIFKELITHTSGDFDEAIKKGSKDSFQKIIETFGESILFEAVMGAAYGRDQFGNRISRQDETMTAKSFE